MGKKTKSQQPNAPGLDQVLWKQPPHNPYYPDLGASSYLISPPSYSHPNIVQTSRGQSVPMTMVSPSANQADYSRLPGQPPNTIVLGQPMTTTNYSRERHHKTIRRYNKEMMFAALISFLSSCYAYSLFQKRPCLLDFLVYQQKDLKIKLSDVKDMHLFLAAGSAFVFFVALVRSVSGKSRSYCIYKFVMGLSTLVLAIASAYLTYWTFYSPCSTKLNQLAANTAKTLLANFEVMPPPEEHLFNEQNVFQLMDEDRKGFAIFILDVGNLIFYLSAFLATTMLC